MIALYIIIAVFIAWIWVDYYRLIDIYENESLKYFILTFILGCSSVLIVIGLNKYLLDSLPFELNGEFVNDFLYCIFKIGLVEEIAKTIPFVVIYFLFKKHINDPIDYLAFISISALGFSAVENVLYFQKHGPYIINSRAILSTVGHMFDTSLIAYGIIRHKYYHKNRGIIGIIIFFFLAALSHGFYDFWLLFEGTKSGGWIITVLYFLITISVFAVILNNAINNSAFFSYKKVIDGNKVAGRLLTYYGIVFLIQFVLLIFFENFSYAIRNLAGSIYFSAFIVVVSCVRLSRFKLIKDRWENLRLELPFTISQGDPYGMRSTRFRLRIKGESFNEAYINIYYEEYFSLNPLSKRNTYIGSSKLTFIERKIFLKNDETFYLAKVFHDSESGQHEKILLKPKTSDTTMVNEKYPIVAVLKIDNIADIENPKSTAKNFKFKEWAFIKPQTTETIK
jgi:RsiW-degrading membrane proteinase PrsW (M82 family)